MKMMGLNNLPPINGRRIEHYYIDAVDIGVNRVGLKDGTEILIRNSADNCGFTQEERGVFENAILNSDRSGVGMEKIIFAVVAVSIFMFFSVATLLYGIFEFGLIALPISLVISGALICAAKFGLKRLAYIGNKILENIRNGKYEVYRFNVNDKLWREYRIGRHPETDFERNYYIVCGKIIFEVSPTSYRFINDEFILAISEVNQKYHATVINDYLHPDFPYGYNITTMFNRK